MRRSFTPQPLDGLAPGTVLPLPAAEAHHLRNVLRLTAGEAVELFDGRGWSVRARLREAARAALEVELLDVPQRGGDRRPRLWLAAAAPKQDRLRWLVEKGVELEVDRLTLLLTRRTIVHPGEGKREKLRDVAVQACKQCGRSDLPVLDPPCALTAWLADWSSVQTRPAAVLLLADCDGTPILDELESISRETTELVAVLIGPEGGWTEEERSAARDAGARAVRLGGQTLRIETAALAAAVCVRARWSAT
jgi:16S rRNA (uracil1498-N3)-methyltransferase